MRRACARTVVLVAIAFICAAEASPPDARAQAAARGGASSDSLAIRSLWSTLDAMWNKRDAEQFSDLFAVDASFEFVDRGQSLESRATIHQHFADQFPKFAPDVRHLTSVRQIRVIAPDVRTVDGKVEILRNSPGESAKPVVLRTFAIFAVMFRTGEGWSIRVLRAYELPAATDEPVDRSKP